MSAAHAFRPEAPNTSEQSDFKNPTVGEIFAAYLDAKRNKNAYKKCKHPETLHVNLLEPTRLWADWTIEDFKRGSRARVEAAVGQWLESGLVFATCRKRCTIMRAAFRFAWKREMIERSQEPFFELPPSGPPRERVIDPVEELPKLLKELDRAPNHLRYAGYILLITGQRVGALLALTWDLVDFEKRVIRFRDTEAPEDRTKKRRTSQPMDDFLFNLLSEAKARATCSHVIEWNGKGCKTIYPGLKRLLIRAGLGDVRVHDFRRSSATFVYHGLGGNLSAAANHIGDSEAVADAVYVQRNIEANLPGIKINSAVIANARRAG